MKLFLSKYTILLFVCGVISSSITGCGLRYTIEGRVIDAETEKPIKGAVVAVKYYTYSIGPPYASGYDETARVEAISDVDGFFEIPRYLLRSYNIGVYKKGYICWDGDVIFRKDVEKVARVSEDREDFELESGMVIRLELLTDEYSRIEHAFFVGNVARDCAPGGHSDFYKAIEAERELGLEFIRERKKMRSHKK